MRGHERLLIIESAAKRLGMTVVVDSFEEKGYNAPSVEEDMSFVSDVFGISPQQEVACEM
jgi:hypothetical protein